MLHFVYYLVNAFINIFQAIQSRKCMLFCVRKIIQKCFFIMKRCLSLPEIWEEFLFHVHTWVKLLNKTKPDAAIENKDKYYTKALISKECLILQDNISISSRPGDNSYHCYSFINNNSLYSFPWNELCRFPPSCKYGSNLQANCFHNEQWF